MYCLPGVVAGIVPGFGSVGVASLRTGVSPRRIGLIFLLLPLTFLFDFSTGVCGVASTTSVIGVVTVLALSMLGAGYLLRVGSGPGDARETGDALDASPN
jgi:hypothetical protein